MTRLLQHKLTFLLVVLSLAAVGGYDLNEEPACGCNDPDFTEDVIKVEPEPIELFESDTSTAQAYTGKGETLKWSMPVLPDSRYVTRCTLAPTTAAKTTITATSAAVIPPEYSQKYLRGVATRFLVQAEQPTSPVVLTHWSAVACMVPVMHFDSRNNSGGCVADWMSGDFGWSGGVHVRVLDKASHNYTFTATATGSNKSLLTVTSVAQLTNQSANILVTAPGQDTKAGFVMIRVTATRADGRTLYGYTRLQVAGTLGGVD